MIQLGGRSYIIFLLSLGGPASVVGIAPAYGMDGSGIESRWGEISAPV